jgi:hypothetical protein
MLRTSARCSVPWDYPTFGSEEITVSDTKPSRTESISSAYRQRITDVEASEERDAKDIAEADGLEHDTHELNEEQKFVGGVSVTKDAESEEDFLPTPGAEDTADESDDDTSEDDEPAEDQGPPTKSWKKAEIVDYLLSADIGVERDDLEAMTKDELLDRFVDNS